MSLLKEKYAKEVVGAFKKEFGIANVFQVPRIGKVVLNVGLGSGVKDDKFHDSVKNSLRRITGQEPLKTLAKKSISNFKIREGQVVGMKVTLRGKRMYDFLDKLVHVAMPRIRDFRGISAKSVDSTGNLHLGFKEHVSFPEIKTDEIERIHGLEISITTNAKDHDKGYALFKYLGFPFAK